MTFDPRSLLQAPPLTVDALAARLTQLSAMGFGAAGLALPNGQMVNVVSLAAEGAVPAHFVLGGLTPVESK